MAAQGDQPYSLMLFNQHFENICHDINTKDSEESTPLHWACFCNSHKIINYLVSLGADVDSQDINGATPLHISLKNFGWKDQRKSFITIQRLYNSGANPKIKDNFGKTALNLAQEFPDKGISKQLLQILKRRKIPWIESGNSAGTRRLVSVVYGIVMTLFISMFLYVMFES